jgi:hypothetical protein
MDWSTPEKTIGPKKPSKSAYSMTAVRIPDDPRKAAAPTSSVRDEEYNTPANLAALAKLKAAKAAPAAPAVTPASPGAGGITAGPSPGTTGEMPGIGGGGSVSLEGYEPTLRSQLNPALGRRLQQQAFSALANVRKPY